MHKRMYIHKLEFLRRLGLKYVNRYFRMFKLNKIFHLFLINGVQDSLENFEPYMYIEAVR